MKIRLGYACVPVTIDETSSHTLTFTNYKKLGNRANEKLDSVIKSNFESLEKILKYNIRNDITFFVRNVDIKKGTGLTFLSVAMNSSASNGNAKSGLCFSIVCLSKSFLFLQFP